MQLLRLTLEKIFFYLLLLYYKKEYNFIFLLKKIFFLNIKILIFFFLDIKFKLNKYTFLSTYNKNKYLNLNINQYGSSVKKYNFKKIPTKKKTFLLFNKKKKNKIKNYLNNIFFFFEKYLTNNFNLINNFNNKYFFKINFKNNFTLNFFLKKHYKNDLKKILNFIIESTYIGIKPFLYLDVNLKNEEIIFNNYLNFVYKNKKNGYIFLPNPNIRLINLIFLKKLMLPIVSIYNENFTNNYTDYSIYISIINNDISYFFFKFFLKIHNLGLILKKNENINIYYNYLNLIFLKKHLILNINKT